MNKFTSILTERDSYQNQSLLKTEITNFINKVKKRIPAKVQAVIDLTYKNNILSKNDINDIKNSSKSSIKHLCAKYDMSEEQMEDLRDSLKDLGNDIKLLPQMMSAAEREALELGRLSMNDLTIDLKTPAGRNAVAKMYMPLVYAIINQFVGKSRLDKSSLISAGLEGLTSAMNDWKSSAESGEKTVSFKTYVGYRVRQQILNDINSLGHSLSGGSSYTYNKYGGALMDAVSLDGIPRDDEGEFKNDRLAALGTEDKLSKEEQADWKSLYKLLESKFSQRDMNIFYRYFGLNGYKREKSKDIAKSYGMSEGNIRNSILNKILKYLKQDRKAMDILTSLNDIYNENLMVDMISYSKSAIIEALASDDLYILLEEMTKWNKKESFDNDLSAVLKSMGSEKNKKFIIDLLSADFNFADEYLKKQKDVILKFMSLMYPTENISKLTDVDKLQKIVELQTLYQKHKNK